MSFEQAAIKVEKQQEFQELKDAIDRVLSPAKAEKFLKRLESTGVRVRDFESVIAKGVLDKVADRASGTSLASTYAALSVSDQGQVREFYLSRLEEVDQELRTRFQKVYRYY